MDGSSLIAFTLPLTALATSIFEPPQAVSSSFPDTETATSMEFHSGDMKERLWHLTFALDASDVNNAQLELGTDADSDGALSQDEAEFVVGWDCGEWFYRDKRAGVLCRSAATGGRNTLDWTLYLTPERLGRRLEGNVFSSEDVATCFNPDWNMARIVIRGTSANELARSSVFALPFVIRIR